MISLNAASEALGAARAYPAQAPCLALTGPAGTGKTYALLERVRSLRASGSAAGILVSAPGTSGIACLQTLLQACGDIGDGGPVAVVPLPELALATLRTAGRVDLELIDDATAAGWFEDACASLFSLEWPELAAAQIDPEITGLRSPQRFAAAAFRLIRKLRAGLVTPAAFRAAGLRGATEFYGKPPNFASSELIIATAQKYRDSLRVDDTELERQRTREVDLVLILARLYGLYAAELTERSALTAGDALYEATLAMRAQPELALGVRARFAAAAIDDAQDLTAADLGFLGAIYGPELRGVTLAGDASAATRGFSDGARGAEVFKCAAHVIAFTENQRSARAIVETALAAVDPLRVGAPGERSDAVSLYRAADERDEARFIASEVRRLLAAGTPAGSIAVVTRHLGCAHAYIDALLESDVPVDVAGNADLYDFPAVLDALAALWAATDPFRHDYLMRNLEAPWLRLADASIAILCGEARDPQPLLFEVPGEDDDEARAGRWDRKRDLRLGRNVTRGDVDAELSDEARERVVTFRAALERWAAWSRTLGPAAAARAILLESALATVPPGARGGFERGLIDRLLERIAAFERREPLGTLHDFLLGIDRADRLAAEPPALLRSSPSAVGVLDVEAAKGYEFDAVFVPDARAGAWPRYYVPDAFLFTPTLGMIAKENVGEATTGRTAKFSYAMFRYRFREKYNLEERRAFAVAAGRARRRLYVSAPGYATRGANTPEILAELEKR